MALSNMKKGSAGYNPAVLQRQANEDVLDLEQDLKLSSLLEETDKKRMKIEVFNREVPMTEEQKIAIHTAMSEKTITDGETFRTWIEARMPEDVTQKKVIADMSDRDWHAAYIQFKRTRIAKHLSFVRSTQFTGDSRGFQDIAGDVGYTMEERPISGSEFFDQSGRFSHDVSIFNDLSFTDFAGPDLDTPSRNNAANIPDEVYINIARELITFNEFLTDGVRYSLGVEGQLAPIVSDGVSPARRAVPGLQEQRESHFRLTFS